MISRLGSRLRRRFAEERVTRGEVYDRVGERLDMLMEAFDDIIRQSESLGMRKVEIDKLNELWSMLNYLGTGWMNFRKSMGVKWGKEYL